VFEFTRTTHPMSESGSKKSRYYHNSICKVKHHRTSVLRRVTTGKRRSVVASLPIIMLKIYYSLGFEVLGKLRFSCCV
jgi:hypothetical protein